ncbi:MAG: YkgJ family cysteine cluster protein [Candidatus Woesearchaeota archaeon]
MENICGSCRNCCTGTLVRVREADLEKWQKGQKYQILICLDRWVDGTTYLKHKDDGSEECLFLTENGCSIYEDRPDVCREFPRSQEQKDRYSCLLKD